MKKIKQHIGNIYRPLVIVFAAMYLVSCNSTKFVPKDKYLLNNVEVTCDNRDVDIQEMKTYLRQTPNTRILGFWKFHLGFYNLSKKGKEEGWLKRIGEAPVIYDPFMAEKSLEQINLYLKSKGYYNASVFDTVTFKKRKAKVHFDVTAGIPHLINNIEYDVRDSILQDIILSHQKKSLIKSGSIFDLDMLDNERDHLVRKVRNKGYYTFGKQVIYFEADTLDKKYLVDLKMVVGKEGSNLDTENITSHKKYFLRNFNIFSDFDPKQAVSNPDEYFSGLDTLHNESYAFIHSQKERVKPEVIMSANHLEDSLYFRIDGIERTYKSLNKLRNFRYINIQFSDGGKRDSLSRWLNCNMQLSPSIPQSYSVELEGTNSSGDFGFATNFSYQHKNIFGGAEIFNVKLKGAMERLRLEEQRSFNTREGGVDLKLTVPKFFSPVSLHQLFKYDTPSSNLNLSYNYQKRPDYTRTISTFRFGYTWESSKYIKHFFNPLDLNMVRIFEKDDDFINSIEDLYIRSSYIDHVISSMNYGFTYNTQELEKRKDYSFLKWNIEVAGNVLQQFSNLTNRKPVAEVDEVTGETIEYYKFLGSRYAQYIKMDIDLRRGWVLDRVNTIVARVFAGVGKAYGNWDQFPFEKQYFGGGANSIRAWQVRSLGPGTYNAPEGAYPNQLGDIKLEANLEYRFKMFWVLEGALFLDAGNIWAMNSKDNREGAVFKWDKFYKEYALGTGFGTRLDFNYAIFRLDFGLKLRDPSVPMGQRWIPSTRSFKREDFVVSFAIGYPF